jgi:hypothetical protein
MITGKMYNWLKFLALVVLPALGTLYVALAALWGLPSAQAVSGTILAVDTFLGALLQISSANYNSSTAQGTLAVHETDDKKIFQLELDGDPEKDLEGRDRVVLKVRKTTEKPAAKKAAARRRRSADA